MALEAANRLGGIKKLAVYEVPFIVDDTRAPIGDDWNRVAEAVENGRRGDAVKLFLKMVGAPGPVVALMPLLPMCAKLKAIAHTLPYDGALVGSNQLGKPLRGDGWATVPALVLCGGKSPEWMRNGSQALARVLPRAEYRILEGQTHFLKPRAHAPGLIEFFRE